VPRSIKAQQLSLYSFTNIPHPFPRSGNTAERTTTTPMTMLTKPRPQSDVIAAHLAAAAQINLSCQPLTDHPTAKLFNLRSNSPLQRPTQPADSTYLLKRSMPIYSKLVPCSLWLSQLHRRHTTFRYTVQQNCQPHPSKIAVADHSICTDAIDDPHRLLPANTPSSDHPKSPAACLQQLTARTESP
jgi:hypothetical protein